MEEKTRRRLGITMWILGFIMVISNGVVVIGHYLVGWSIPSFVHPFVVIGIAFLAIGMTTALKKRQN